jgi:hypothetical protein
LFVITADQADSRHATDLVPATLAELKRVGGRRLRRAPVRTIGDELQVLTDDAGCALDLILWLDRDGRWSTGCGVGRVSLPLPRDTRSASGPAFFTARDAVTVAKRRSPRFALGVDDASGRTAADVQPLIDLLLLLRARRTEEGWQLHDLLAGGLTQSEAADRLGISAQAVSQRARTAALKLERDARPALVRLLAEADVPSEAV